MLITTEGDRVDAMFVDQRGSGANSDILVVTCEGNAGFYETGIMMIPLALNYSVLGWNQPGNSSLTSHCFTFNFLLLWPMIFEIRTCFWKGGGRF